ncbi:rhophilin-2-like isoform X2 [Ornithodoros turicata]|uniref:rhophilin-2-like isoform X2 n=1 Tax=Ornithodoros turicata TaxID=34597 RepID=UPI0031387DD0
MDVGVKHVEEWMDNLNNLILGLKQGSDPRAATCRGKLQYRRSKINHEITKQMMMRNGAEKLFKATTNKKLRETVALELSFLNSNLQLLKEQLAELNSSVQIYQSENQSHLVPMIPLGLKETKDIDFQEPFKDFIMEHYSEDSMAYDSAIQEFMDVRQAARTPTRDQAGVQLLFEYYNLLYFVDRRFFPPSRSMGIFFEWFDSLTGVPSTQKTAAFEKASVLFNIAALYTQIGAKQDRSKSSGIDSAVDSFLRAAGMFCYIRENFSKPPSMDLSSDTLESLTHIMLAQARECLFEKLILSNVEKQGISTCIEVGQEAAEVAEVYTQLHKLMSTPPVKDYVPYSWISLILVKAEHYKALAHYYIAVGLLDHSSDIDESVRRSLEFLHVHDQTNSTCIDIRVPETAEDKRQLGKAHLREALLLHEEALRLHRMCRQLRQVDNLLRRLRADHDIALQRYADLEQEDDFQEVLDPPKIQASTKYQLTLTSPDFTQYKVKDLFHGLGPISIFSARHHWSAARAVHLTKKGQESFGFSVRGDSPVIVAGVEPCSLAELAGVKEGDFIVAIGKTDTKWSTHDEVVQLIREAGHELTVRVITPMDRTYLRQSPASSTSSSSSSSGVSSSGSSSRLQSPNGSIASNKSKDGHKRLTWNFFRRGTSKERPSATYDANVLLR